MSHFDSCFFSSCSNYYPPIHPWSPWDSDRKLWWQDVGHNNTGVHPTSKKDLNTAQVDFQACTPWCPLTLSLVLYWRPWKESERFQQWRKTEGHRELHPLSIRSRNIIHQHFFFQVEVLNSHNQGHPQSQTEVCSPRARLDASLDHKEPMGSRKEPKWSGHPGKLGSSGHVSFTKQYRKIQFFNFVFKWPKCSF